MFTLQFANREKESHGYSAANARVPPSPHTCDKIQIPEMKLCLLSNVLVQFCKNNQPAVCRYDSGGATPVL